MSFARKILISVVALFAIITTNSNAQISLTIPASAGGQSHKVAIALQARMTEWAGQPVLFDFRPGGGGVVGARHVMQSTAPVHLFLMLAQTQPNFEIDQLNDIVPVIELGTQTFLIYAKSNIGVTTWKELANSPGKKYSYGMVNASGLDLYMAGLLQTMKQHEFTMVPYKSGAPMMADVVGKHVDLAMTVVSTIQPFVMENKVIPLLVTSPTRSDLLPGVPSRTELGLRFAHDNHTPVMFLFANKNSNPEIIERIRKGWAQWVVTAEGKTVMAGLDIDPPAPGIKPEISLRKLLGRQ